MHLVTSKQFYSTATLILFVITLPLLAADKSPSGADLLAACQHSMDQGFSNVQGMLCSWYVTPCDCNYEKKRQLPRVCLPGSPDIDLLAQQVISGLNARPELLNMEADIAASTILTRYYPCSE